MARHKIGYHARHTGMINNIRLIRYTTYGFFNQYRIVGDFMADNHSKEVRSMNMSHICSTNSKPEERVRKYLFSRGLRYRKNVRKLPGCPDIVLKKYKTVIFVSHSVTQMKDFCDRIIWMHNGEILADDCPENLILPYCAFAREYSDMTIEQQRQCKPNLEYYNKIAFPHKYKNIVGGKYEH